MTFIIAIVVILLGIWVFDMATDWIQENGWIATGIFVFVACIFIKLLLHL